MNPTIVSLTSLTTTAMITISVTTTKITMTTPGIAPMSRRAT